MDNLIENYTELNEQIFCNCGNELVSEEEKYMGNCKECR